MAKRLTLAQKGLAIGHKMSPEERQRVHSSNRDAELYWKADKLTPDERRFIVEELARIRALPKAERAAAYQDKLATVILKVPFLMDIMPAPELIRNAAQIAKLIDIGNEAFGLNADKRGQTVINVGMLGAERQVTEIKSVSPSQTVRQADILLTT